MATVDFETVHTAGAGAALRLFNLTGANAGKAYDFNDNAWETIGAATTPYKSGTESASMAGTGNSGYTCAVNLSLLPSPEVVQRIVPKWYAGATPATTVAVLEELDPFFVRFGMFNPVAVRVGFELNVKSTAGSTAQIGCWLEQDGVRITSLTGIDATPALSVVVREHGSGVNLFTASGDESDLIDDHFEIEQASPAFTNDRQYTATCSITLNSTTFTSTHRFVVIG